MCNKVGYPSRADALRDAKLILNQERHFKRYRNVSRKSAKKFHSYKCFRCGQWHLTTTRRRKEYKRKNESRSSPQLEASPLSNGAVELPD